MDVRSPASKDNEITSGASQPQEPVIRTMKDDLALLEKRPRKSEAAAKQKRVSPPAELPVVESIRPLEIRERIEQTRKKLEREREKIRERSLAGAEEKEAPQVDKIERVEKIKEERPTAPPAPKPAPAPTLAPAPVSAPAPEAAGKQRNIFPYLAAGLAVILIVVGLGGFFYWRKPGPEPAVVATHQECRESACVEAEGEGEDECLNNEECAVKPPVIPISVSSPLISVDGKEIIEINSGDEDLILEEVKLLPKEESKVRQVLVKLISGDGEEYLDLAELISTLGLKLPNEILNSENHTLFIFGQPAGNRFGLVIDMEESIGMSEALKNWETTIKDDLSSLFIPADVSEPATEEFQENTYQGVKIRYMNFSTPELSIDYAVKGNILILTNSRESMYQAIDRMKSE